MTDGAPGMLLHEGAAAKYHRLQLDRKILVARYNLNGTVMCIVAQPLRELLQQKIHPIVSCVPLHVHVSGTFIVACRCKVAGLTLVHWQVGCGAMCGSMKRNASSARSPLGVSNLILHHSLATRDTQPSGFSSA